MDFSVPDDLHNVVSTIQDDCNHTMLLSQRSFQSATDFFIPKECNLMQCTFCNKLVDNDTHVLIDHIMQVHSKEARCNDTVDEMDPRHKNLKDSMEKLLLSQYITHENISSLSFQAIIQTVNPHLLQPFQEVLGSLQSVRLEENTMVGFSISNTKQGVAQLVYNLKKPIAIGKNVLIRVLRAGICGTDLEMLNNYKPGFHGVLGHEFVGVVQDFGDDIPESVHSHWLGQRVVGEINIPCESQLCSVCADCITSISDTCTIPSALLIQQRNHCPRRKCLGIVDHDGVFAQYATLPLQNLYIVPPSVPDSHAVFTEPLAAAYRIIEQQCISPEDSIVILGDGKLGLLVLEVLHAVQLCKSITIIGRHRSKLDLVDSYATQSHVYSSELIKQLENSFTICIECTGTETGIQSAIQLTQPHGTIIMKSTCSAATSPVPIHNVQRKHLKIIGSRCGPFSPALKLLEEKKVDVQKYIDAVFPLHYANDAFQYASRKGALKTQFIM